MGSRIVTEYTPNPRATGQCDALDLVYLAPSQRRQPEIYEHPGMKAEAVTHYARFVDLWKDASPSCRNWSDKLEMP